MAFFAKTTNQILTEALAKLTASTTITSTSPGSVARAFTEAISIELGGLYSVLDFNFNQYNLSTASGSSLDLIGSLYAIKRKTVETLTMIDRAVGAFYFFILTPYNQDITIPSGTLIYTDNVTYVGTQLSYVTTNAVTISTGRTKAYASITPQFANSVSTAGINTLTVIGNFVQPVGTTVMCTNPKIIEAQVGHETDESYRYRITQAVRTASGGTLNAVRLAGINVAGVRDIAVRNTPYGLGSFECLVTPEDYTQSNTVLTDATTAMSLVSPVGVRMYTRLPLFRNVDVACTVILSNTTNVNIDAITSAVQVSILRFLNQPLIGSALVYNELINAILDVDAKIIDVTITNLQVNATQILFQNYTPKDDEQLVPGTITVSSSNAGIPMLPTSS